MKKKNVPFIISISFNVLIVLALSTFIFYKGGLSYVVSKFQGQPTQEFSLYHQVYKSVFDVYSSDSSDIVFVGDSLTTYVNWNELLENNGVKTRGVPGDKTKDLLDNLSIILDDQPSKIFIMLGINDLSNGLDPSDTLENYEKIIKQIQTESPNTELVIQSVLPINTDILEQTETNNDTILEFNANLQKMTEDNGLKYIDLASHFMKDGKLDSSLTVDGIHLNGQGYIVWKDIIKTVVNS